jgi:hypothetical protein
LRESPGFWRGSNHGVEFPTDFRDLVYIEFEKDDLAEESMELLRKLGKLRAVRVVAGSAG